MFELRTPDAEDRKRKDKARAQWERDRASLVFQQPFIASLALYLDVVAVMDDRLRTASTDGRRVFVDVDFLASLDEEERLFLLAHEVWHCALGNLKRQGEREAERWNFAIDHEVNALLIEQGFKMPADGVFYRDMVGKNAEEVYEWLERGGPAAAEREDEGGPQSALAGGRGRLADQHLGAAASRAEQAAGEGEPSEVPPREEPAAGEPRAAGESERGRGPRYDPDYGPYLDRAELERWPGRVLIAAQQHERRFGTLPGGLQAVVDRLRHPTLPWRELLRQFITRLYGGERTWLPPSRRHLARGLFLPSRREETVSLTVALDTSGSTYEYLGEFLSELSGLVTTFGRYRIRVLQCDCEITLDRVFDADDPLDASVLPVGGLGGTNFTPVFELLGAAEERTPLVYLTDGDGPPIARAPDFPVLWILTPGGRAPVPWGEVILLPERVERE